MNARATTWLRPEVISSWGEFVLVTALLLALPIRNSTEAALHGSSGHFMDILLSNKLLLWTVFGESLLLGLFLYYLKWRGWRPADFRIGLGWWTSVQGVGLLALSEIAVICTIFGLVGVVYALQTTQHTFISFSWRYPPISLPTASISTGRL